VLGGWVIAQRDKLRQRSLEAWQCKMLDELGFSVDVVFRKTTPSSRWIRRYNELVEFQIKFGHCHVPYLYKPNPQLGGWVAKQRYFLSKGRISYECIAKLDDIGFRCNALRDGKFVYDASLDEGVEGGDEADNASGANDVAGVSVKILSHV
jgi:hypothetical protein